jgi:hypothetical protein
MNNRVLIAGALSLLVSLSAQTSLGVELPYGTKAGMEVSIVATSGLDGPNAIVEIEHRRENAQNYCVAYLADYSHQCTDQTMRELHLAPVLMGDCLGKTWTDVYGAAYQLLGRNPAHDPGMEYLIRQLGTGETLDGSNASGYYLALSALQALCPGLTK